MAGVLSEFFEWSKNGGVTSSGYTPYEHKLEDERRRKELLDLEADARQKALEKKLTLDEKKTAGKSAVKDNETLLGAFKKAWGVTADYAKTGELNKDAVKAPAQKVAEPTTPTMMDTLKTVGQIGANQMRTGELDKNAVKQSAGMGKQAAKKAAEVAGKAAKMGVNQVGYAIASTAELLAPTDFLGDKDPFQKLKDFQREGYEAASAELQKAMQGTSEEARFAGELISAVVAAIPQSILAMMSGGASAAATPATVAAQGATNAGLTSSIGTAVTQMIRNPSTWYSVTQTLGPTYDEQKEAGASDLEAAATALISSALNAGIEVGGGLETISGKRGVKEWVKSAFEEGREEAVQGVITGITERLVWNRNKAIFSTTDENAIFNPGRMAQEFGMGAAVGGILSGAQMGVSVIANGRPVSRADFRRAVRNTTPGAANATDAQIDAIYGRVAQMQAEAQAKQDAQAPVDIRAQAEAAFREAGMKKTAKINRKIDTIKRLMAGKRVSDDDIDNLALSDAANRKIFSDLTGVDFDGVKLTHEALRNAARGAANAQASVDSRAAKTAENASGAVAEQSNREYTEINKEAVTRGEEVHLRDGGQRSGSADPGGQVSRMEEGAGRAEGREADIRPADREAAALTHAEEKVSARSLGIAGGTENANIHIVTGGETEATGNAKRLASERGLELVLFSGGNLDIESGGATASARAYIDGNKAFVRADHPKYTAEQIMLHEAGHDMIAKGEIDPEAVRDRIGQDRAEQVSRMYADAYEGSGMTAQEIWEEVICDSVADMNIFADQDGTERTEGVDARTDESGTDVSAERERGPPEGKMSREPIKTGGDAEVVSDIQKSVRSAVREELERMGKEYGWIKPGERPARDIQMPKRTSENKKLSQTVRTVMEAGATPEEMLPDIEKLAADGEFSFESYSDKQAIQDAAEEIGGANGKGWTRAYSEWSNDIKKRKGSKKLTAVGWTLYNNAANSGDTELALDILRQMARHQRDAAQALQATRILKKLSPESQLYGIQKAVDDINEELRQRHGQKRRGQKQGNVPVELWMQRTGELLADQLGKAVSGKPTRKEMTVSQRVLADLRKLAKETVVPAARPADTRTEMDSIYDMFNNQEHYEKALEAAKETVAKEYGDNPEIMEALDQWMQTAFDYTAKFTKEFTGQTEIQIPKELVDKFLSQTDQNGRDEVTKEIYLYVGSQLPSRFIDKWNAWRYLAMLGNPRTHVRNIVGNAGFAPVVATKSLTATAIESVVSRVSGGKIERTKAFVGVGKGDRKILKAAWDDYANVDEVIQGSEKYSDHMNANHYIEEGRRIFENKYLEAARKKNVAAMSAEDTWFSKPHYAFAMAQYCKANGITAEQIAKGEGLDKARAYAVKEAKKATYRDSNQFSDFISQIGRRDSDNVAAKAVSTLAEGILPFRKTPANILVRGVEYSPIGLLKGLTYDLSRVKGGEMSAAEAIDNISAGLTGTGLLGLGVLLAAEGLVRGSGTGDDKEKEFDELQGAQRYSLEIGGTSITLDWLAPECIPFFMGVNLWEGSSKQGMTLSDWFDALKQSTEPMLEMSCLQSLNDMLDSISYAQTYGGSDGLTAALISGAVSYFMQALPTLGGQIERTGQAERMTTYTDKNSWIPTDVQYTIGKASGRIPIPGVDYNQIPYIDAWGRTERDDSVVSRLGSNMFNPAYTSELQESDMERELERLHALDPEVSVLPSRAKKSFSVNGEEKHLTGEEYVQYATAKGQLSYDLMEELVSSDSYKSMPDTDKAEAVNNVYSYANAVAKTVVSDYELNGWVAEAKACQDEYGIPVSLYISAYASTKDLEGIKTQGGKSAANSKAMRIMQQLHQIPGLTDTQRDKLADDLGAGAVKKYSPALIEQKLSRLEERYEEYN